MREYFAAICKIPEGNFVVFFPDLPDCVAFADSLETVREAASIALADYIDEAERIGEHIPEPSTSEAIRSDPQNMGCYVFRVKALRPVKKRII
jgi:predicted RNase H-like HicB family nuclease